jgi:hypothetical protein
LLLFFWWVPVGILAPKSKGVGFCPRDSVALHFLCGHSARLLLLGPTLRFFGESFVLNLLPCCPGCSDGFLELCIFPLLLVLVLSLVLVAVVGVLVWVDVGKAE